MIIHNELGTSTSKIYTLETSNTSRKEIEKPLSTVVALMVPVSFKKNTLVKHWWLHVRCLEVCFSAARHNCWNRALGIVYDAFSNMNWIWWLITSLVWMDGIIARREWEENFKHLIYCMYIYLITLYISYVDTLCRNSGTIECWFAKHVAKVYCRFN